MELRVETVEASTVPEGCYVGIRIGDIIKQGKLRDRQDPQRCYHFPPVDRRRNAKVDVYRHVGSCVFFVDPDSATLVHNVGVTSTDPAFSNLGLKVTINTALPDVTNKEKRDERAVFLKSQAKEYLFKHGVEERLSSAVKALLKDQPDDATEFLCRHLRGTAPDQQGSLAAPVPVKQTRQSLSQAEQNPQENLRSRAMESLLGALENGSLEPTLKELVTQAPKADLEIVGLRQQACDSLVAALGDGKLATAVAEYRRPSQEARGELRQGLQVAFSQAQAGGTLSGSLQELEPPQEVSHIQDTQLRQSASSTLAEASASGRLFAELSALDDDDVVCCDGYELLEAPEQQGDLRLQVGDALLKASGKGTLLQTLDDIKGEGSPRVELLTEDRPLGVLKEEACNVLIQASQEGRLLSMLDSMVSPDEVPSAT